MKGAVYVNGTITPADQAVIPVYDHGFVYGEGVYETLRTYNRVPFLYDRHMRRLRASAAALHLDVPFDDDTMLGWIQDTMALANHCELPERRDSEQLDEAYLRILLTRGVGELSYDLKATPAPSLVIIVKPFEEPPARMFDEGITISLVSVLRNHPGAVNPIIKSNNLLNNALAMQEAHRKGAEEALMCNYRGELSECSQSNFFVVRDGVALTPRSASGLLEGLTRGFLFEVGRDVGVPVEEATLRPAGPRDGAGGVHHRLDAGTDAGRAHRRSGGRHWTSGAGDAEAARRVQEEGVGAERAGSGCALALTAVMKSHFTKTAKRRSSRSGFWRLLFFAILVSFALIVLPPVAVVWNPAQVRAPISSSTYVSIGGHEQIKFRSPYGLSMRLTAGQNLFARTNGAGYAACWRV